MEDALAAVRRIFAEENVGKATLASAEPRTPGEGTETRPDAELLSAEARVAIGSAISTLRETVKKQEPTHRGSGPPSALPCTQVMGG
jgi:hypothetical protein